MTAAFANGPGSASATFRKNSIPQPIKRSSKQPIKNLDAINDEIRALMSRPADSAYSAIELESRTCSMTR